MSLSPEDHAELTHSAADVLDLLNEVVALSVSTTFNDLSNRVGKLVQEHGPEIAMKALTTALRLAGVPLPL